MSILQCPVCHQSLTQHSGSYRCQNQHNYDIAKDGYVNLHLVQHKRSKHSGDTPKAVMARRRFLSSGFYAPLKDAIAQQIMALDKNNAGLLALDIGCGEGYYTDSLVTANGTVFGLDIAKSAVQIAAKKFKANTQITWLVGTANHLPVMNGALDVCTSFFSPILKQEIVRVLKPNGILIVAVAGSHHLYELREQLFDAVQLHHSDKVVQLLQDDFDLIDKKHICTALQLDNAALTDLIAMTPYAYKARPSNIEQVRSHHQFCVQAQFDVFVFKKASLAQNR